MSTRVRVWLSDSTWLLRDMRVTEGALSLVTFVRCEFLKFTRNDHKCIRLSIGNKCTHWSYKIACMYVDG